MEIEVFPTDELPIEVIESFISESESHGLQFIRRLVDEWQTGTNRFEGPGEKLFVARHKFVVVGVCGLSRDPYLDDHSVGRVRRLYVAEKYRGRGVGQKLVQAVINMARESFQTLRLRTKNPVASQLFEKIGFRRVTDVADTSHWRQLEESSTCANRE